MHLRLKPCYQWAQNYSHIFLKFKFTTKLDKPGMIEPFNLEVKYDIQKLNITAFTYQVTPLINIVPC